MSRKLDVVLARSAHEAKEGASWPERNNLAGMGAYGRGGNGLRERADCIDYLARLLAGGPEQLDKWGPGMQRSRWAARWQGAWSERGQWPFKMETTRRWEVEAGDQNLLWVEHGVAGAKVGRKPGPLPTFADHGLCFKPPQGRKCL